MRFSGEFLDIFFGDGPLEPLLTGLEVGATLSAATLMTTLEAGEEDTLDQVLWLLEDKAIKLDISDLPKSSGNAESALRLKMEEELAARGELLSGLESDDPLRIYLEEVTEIQNEDISPLIQQLRESNEANKDDPQLWEKLLKLCLPRVVELACLHTGHGVLLLDLIQEGSMSLWQSFSDFQEGDFAQYRDDRIRWGMVKTVVLQAWEDGVGQKMRQAMEDYRAVDERLLGELGRNPTLEEIAAELHMTVQETGQVADMLSNARRMQQNHKVPEPEEEELAETQEVENTAYFQMRQRIAELLSTLEETDAKILTLRFGLEAGLPQSVAEVGKQLGLTPDEVSAREAAALGLLREQG